MAAVERGSGQEVLETWMKAQLDEHLTEPNSRLGASHSVHARHCSARTLLLRQSGAPLDQQAR